jgi:hypothetical protein
MQHDCQETESMTRACKIVLSLLAAGGLPTPADAADFCAASSSQIVAALAAAETNGEDDVLRIVAGTFVSPQPNGFEYLPFNLSTDSSRNLVISGGFVPGCGAQIIDARQTVLSGALLSPVLRLQSANGKLTLVNFTVTGGYSAASVGAVDISYFGSVATGPEVRIERILFRYNAGWGALRVQTSKPILLLGSLFHSNLVRHAAARIVQEGIDGSLIVHSNTVADTVADPGFGTAGVAFEVAVGTQTAVFNNIFWANDNFDFHLVGTLVPFSWNIYGTAGGNGTFGGNGNTFTDPLFVDPAAGDYGLRIDSPAVDTGGTVSPSVVWDLHGSLRPMNLILDRGALERTPALFADGFESGDFASWSLVAP